MMDVYSEQPVSVYCDKKEMAFNRQMLQSAKYNIPSSVDENCGSWGSDFQNFCIQKLCIVRDDEAMMVKVLQQKNLLPKFENSTTCLLLTYRSSKWCVMVAATLLQGKFEVKNVCCGDGSLRILGLKSQGIIQETQDEESTKR